MPWSCLRIGLSKFNPGIEAQANTFPKGGLKTLILKPNNLRPKPETLKPNPETLGTASAL